MSCQDCKSERVISVYGKTSDLCAVSIGEHDHDGYVPSDMNIGGGDDLAFDFCADCGQIQGHFPLPTTELEGAKSSDEDEEDY